MANRFPDSAPVQPTAATLAAPDAAAAPPSAPPVAAEAHPAAAADSAAAPPLAPTQQARRLQQQQHCLWPSASPWRAQNSPSAAPAVDAATAAHYAAYGMAYGGSPHAPHYAQGISGIGAHQGDSSWRAPVRLHSRADRRALLGRDADAGSDRGARRDAGLRRALPGRVQPVRVWRRRAWRRTRTRKVHTRRMQRREPPSSRCAIRRF